MKVLYRYIILLGGFMIGMAGKGSFFIENRGQWDSRALARGNLLNGVVFVENNALTYFLHNADKFRYGHNALFGVGSTDTFRLHAFRYQLLHGKNPLSVHCEDKLPHYYNFFTGQNPQQWISYVPAYHTILLSDIYDGVDWKIYYTPEHVFKYDFIVRPFADPSQIRWNYEGADKVYLTAEGNIRIITTVGEIMEQKPYAYQWVNGQKKEVQCFFSRHGSEFYFTIGKYHKAYALYIDPVLVFASYTGSTADNFGMTATYDLQGQLITGGMAYNMGYPTTLGAYDVTFNGTPGPNITDVVITKFNNNGSNLVFSTYLGGSSTETAQSLIVDSLNNVIVYGVTGSSDFPITPGAYDNTFGGGSSLSVNYNGTTFSSGTDIYVAKLNASGTTLLASTYLGGSGNDGVNYNQWSLPYNSVASYDSITTNYGDQFRGEVMIDRWNNIYVASCTRSVNFPMANAYQSTFQGVQDAVVVKFDPMLSTLKFSTYLGGQNKDAAYSVKVDTSGIMYVCGGTSSVNFPTTAGVLSSSYNGGKTDGFVCKLDSNGTLLASTYVGTSLYDQVFFVEIDKYKDVYILGQSLGNMPVTPGVYSNPNSKQFIQKINNSFSQVLYSSVFGNGNGNINISPSAFLVDRCQNVYVSGWGANILQSVPLSNMPVTSNAYQTTTDGFDFYLIVFERDLQSLLYAGPFGGNVSKEHVDGGTSRFSKEGVVYQSVCGGCGGHSDFPTTPGCWSSTNNSPNCNNAVFQLDFQIEPHAQFSVSDTMGCVPFTIQFTNNSTNGSQFIWIFDDGDTSYLPNPVKTYLDTGLFVVRLLLYDSICDLYDTVQKNIYVGPQLQLITMNDTAVCQPITIPVWASNGSGGGSFVFSTNSMFSDTLNNALTDSVINITITQDTTIYIKLFSNYCELTDSVKINFYNLKAMIMSDTLLCAPDTVYITNLSQDYDSLVWNFPLVPSGEIPVPYVYFAQSGLYMVQIIAYNHQCGDSDTSELWITVKPQVQLNVANDTMVCDSAFLWVIGNQSGLQYQWSSQALFNDTLSLSSSWWVGGGTGIQYYYVTATNGVCNYIDSVKVEWKGIYVNVQDTFVCGVDELMLWAQVWGDLTGVQYNWQPASEVVADENTNHPLVNSDQTTSFSVTVTNGYGCSDADQMLLQSFEALQNIFSLTATEDTLYVPSQVCFNIAPYDPLYQYQWLPVGAFQQSNIAHPCTYVSQTGTYEVVITDTNGCSLVKRITVYVLEVPCGDPNIYVPNAFTPNGDGNNDVLYVRGHNITEMQWMIFDRWGEKVFEAYDQREGWDGTYKGRPVDPAVYVYHLRVVCGDGQGYFTKGNVTVIR